MLDSRCRDLEVQRIRFWRMAQGFTQDRLAIEASRIAGIVPALTKGFVSLLEADKTQPSVSTLHGIAKALGTTLEYLVTGETGRKRQTPPVNLKTVMRSERTEIVQV